MQHAMRTRWHAAASLLALVACGKGGDGQAPPLGPLAETSWVLEDLAGTGVVEPGRATLAIDALSRASGKGSCNRFSGPVTISGDSISFGPLISTRMACVEPALMTQESSYLVALGRAARYTVEGATLRIFLEGGGEPLRFSRTTAP
jgi:heat shock protein HslJ